MYEMKFWFEHGGGCLWSGNDETRNAFGYKVSYDTLPVSDTLKDTLTALEERYLQKPIEYVCIRLKAPKTGTFF